MKNTTPMTSLTGLVLALALVATACLGGSDASESSPADEPAVLAFDDAESAAASGDTIDSDAATGDTTEVETDDGATTPVPEERPCEGEAFPDDDEFRQALCNVQWAQTDVLRTGGEFDPEWGPRQAEATLLYATDRDAALALLAGLEAEMLAAAGAPAPTESVTADDVEEVRAETAGLRECMVEVGFLIIDAQLSGFDPTTVQEWDEDVDDIEALVDDGNFAAAEVAVCDLRDEIAAAIEDPALIGG